jgi:hypothetical protein
MTKKTPHKMKAESGRLTLKSGKIQGTVKPLPKKKAADGEKGPKKKKAATVTYSHSFVTNLLAPAPPVQLSLYEGQSLVEGLNKKAVETLERELGPDWDKITIGRVSNQTEGIDPDGSLAALLHCLHVLLDSQSEVNKNHKEPGYYMGRDSIKINIHGVERELRAPTISVTAYELAKMLNNDEHPSGLHIRRVKELMEKLNNEQQRFIIKFPAEVRKQPNGDDFISYRKMYEKLIKVEEITELQLNKKTGEPVRKSEGYLITLHPVFVQFNRGYVPVRRDTIKKLQARTGGDFLLYLYLARALSHKKPGDWITTANEEELFSIVYKEEFKAKRWKRMREKLGKSIEASKRSGVLLDAEPSIGSYGQRQWVFTLNPDYPWDFPEEKN